MVGPWQTVYKLFKVSLRLSASKTFQNNADQVFACGVTHKRDHYALSNTSFNNPNRPPSTYGVPLTVFERLILNAVQKRSQCRPRALTERGILVTSRLHLNFVEL